MIKTSIIVPVYNTAKYLNDCFNSIFNQTQKEIEVIAINDGSTDDSLNILEEIKKEHPELIIFSQNNKGLGAARNKGMEFATGEFIYFIDSDDCMVNTAMDTCYMYAKNNQLDIVMFDAETFGDIECAKDDYNRSKIIKEQEIIMSGEEYARKYWRQAYYPSACLIYSASSFLKENNLKFISGIYYEDNEFHCKSIPLANRIMYIPYALYKRRYRESSITASAFDMRHARDMLLMVQAIHGQKCSKQMKEAIHEVEKIFLRTLYNGSVKNELLKERQFAEEFYEMALHICGGTIENINNYQDIEILYLISEVIPLGIVSGEVKGKIQDKRKEVWDALLAEIPFKSKNAVIGIFGTGKNTDRFLDEYQIIMGQINSEIIPIESSVITGEKKYRDWNVVNVDDIGALSLECIVIASSKFEQEMCDTIRQKYGNQFKLIRLSTDLHF